MPQAQTCIFCKIIAGDVPASVLHRDDVCIAFMDICPVNEGHLLVIPLKHGVHLAEIDGDTTAHIMRVGQRMAAALRASGLKCEGVNFFLADGEAAGQEVFHMHLHVFPRHRGDGFGLHFGPHYKIQPRPALDAAAEKIRAALI